MYCFRLQARTSQTSTQPEEIRNVLAASFLLAGWLLGLLINTEDGSSKFL
jgi:hypothetical protein